MFSWLCKERLIFNAITDNISISFVSPFSIKSENGVAYFLLIEVFPVWSFLAMKQCNRQTDHALLSSAKCFEFCIYICVYTFMCGVQEMPWIHALSIIVSFSFVAGSPLFLVRKESGHIRPACCLCEHVSFSTFEPVDRFSLNLVWILCHCRPLQRCSSQQNRV
jgi:hypothetical protein